MLFPLKVIFQDTWSTLSMVRTIVLFYEQKVELHVPTYLTTKLIFLHECMYQTPSLFKCLYYRQIVHRHTLIETLNCYYKNFFFIFLGIVTITILRIYKISTYTSHFVKRYCIQINIDVDQLTFAWFAHSNIYYCKDFSILSIA